MNRLEAARDTLAPVAEHSSDLLSALVTYRKTVAILETTEDLTERALAEKRQRQAWLAILYNRRRLARAIPLLQLEDLPPHSEMKVIE